MIEGQLMDVLLDYMAQNWNTVLGVFAATISVLGAVFSRIDARARRKHGHEQIRQSVVASRRAWGEAVIDAISEGAALASMGSMEPLKFFDERERCATKLSSLIDRGRLFFPNLPSSRTAKDKESAYSGRRLPLLDAIVYAFYEVETLGLETDLDSRTFIVRCRRAFVSELQTYLDPQRTQSILTEEKTAQADEEAIQLAGELGVILNLRRPGLLTQKNDNGWTDEISSERRSELLKEYGGNSTPTAEDKLDHQNED